MEHACWGDVPATIPKSHARSDPQLHTQLASMSTSSLFEYEFIFLSWKSDNFQQDWLHKTFCSAPSIARLPGGIFHNVGNSM
ncbi:hypothetical protein TNCV_3389281 [Trichonephila clavipes]|nr:hypothetical protein TNCV_3389281 [Trichonephila clavipes]